MMKSFRRMFYSFIIILCANFLTMCMCEKYMLTWKLPLWLKLIVFGGLLLLSVFLCFKPQFAKQPEKMLCVLSDGCELLRLFLYSVTVTVAYQILVLVWMIRRFFPWRGADWDDTGLFAWWLAALFVAIFVEAAVFWAGMLRIYASSVQLGLKHRIWAVILAWIPICNILYLIKMIRIAEEEVQTEAEKISIDDRRKQSEICHTKYPLLLVHGVFFRDFRYFNYWGRIPGELKKNGAEVYYGEQQSAQSVEECGRELAEKIQQIVKETGCEKLNIIAHSKGGLDSRAAISHYGAAPYVASLTTINTPHRGCVFAEYLLKKIPQKVRNKVAVSYNTTLKRFGDKNPDFLAAVTDLTASVCEERNEKTQDDPSVLYESVMSYCKKAKSGRFPLNMSYPLVKHFDGKNDGLVAVESAEWGSSFQVIEPKGRRGISHGDMIDLNRENFKGFDVREFYVSLVSHLRERGY